MDGLSLSTPNFPATILAGKHHQSNAATATSFSFALKPAFRPPTNSSLDPVSSSHFSSQLRRPCEIPTPTKPSSSNAPKIPSNPLKNLVSSTRVSNPPASSPSLTNKLRLTSKLSPPPPAPAPPPSPPTTPRPIETENEANKVESENSDSAEIELREDDKIFVGNLPHWIKKNEVAEFFRQFGPIKNVILIKGHGETERNAGFGFVLYGGSDAMAAESAMKAVEFDGVEFHGRVLTVKLDDGRRLKERSEARARYVRGYEGVEYRSKWHEERESSRRSFRMVVDTEPENWQAVVQSFERIKKVKLINALFFFGL